MVRGRTLPGVREGKVTVRSVSETMRRVEIATVQTEGAREGQGGVGVRHGPAVDVPGDRPDSWIDLP